MERGGRAGRLGGLWGAGLRLRLLQLGRQDQLRVVVRFEWE